MSNSHGFNLFYLLPCRCTSQNQNAAAIVRCLLPEVLNANGQKSLSNTIGIQQFMVYIKYLYFLGAETKKEQDKISRNYL
jgi:hypothetical protein